MTLDHSRSHVTVDPRADLAAARDLLRARGLRWTPQRRILLDVLATAEGHVSGAELVDRCRAADPATTPSTVYRTLDVLESVGLVQHGHGPDGREEYHVLPGAEHGHLYCAACGSSWNLEADELRSFVAGVRRRRGFEVDLSHVTVVGRCATCAAGGRDPAGGDPGRGDPAGDPA
jgi:Fur family transcriptional regulator, ferric uptake regulator